MSDERTLVELRKSFEEVTRGLESPPQQANEILRTLRARSLRVRGGLTALGVGAAGLITWQSTSGTDPVTKQTIAEDLATPRPRVELTGPKIKLAGYTINSVAEGSGEVRVRLVTDDQSHAWNEREATTLSGQPAVFGRLDGHLLLSITVPSSSGAERYIVFDAVGIDRETLRAMGESIFENNRSGD